MLIYIILWILAICSSGSLCYLTATYDKWYFILIYVAVIPLFLLFWFGIYCAILFIFSLFIKKEKEINKPKKIYTWVIRQTSYVILKIFKARIKKTGPDFPKERFLVIHNHTSNFDPMPFLWLYKDTLTCISKPSNLKIPIAGPFITRGGFIPIDRDNDFNAVKAIIKATNNIKNDIGSVYLCPEGTRNHHPENGMLEWKPGGLKVAYKSKCPIVVTALSNTHLLATKKWFYSHTNVYVDVLEIIPYEKYKDMNTQELADYCKNLIAKKLEERK